MATVRKPIQEDPANSRPRGGGFRIRGTAIRDRSGMQEFGLATTTTTTTTRGRGNRERRTGSSRREKGAAGERPASGQRRAQGERAARTGVSAQAVRSGRVGEGASKRVSGCSADAPCWRCRGEEKPGYPFAHLARRGGRRTVVGAVGRVRVRLAFLDQRLPLAGDTGGWDPLPRWDPPRLRSLHNYGSTRMFCVVSPCAVVGAEAMFEIVCEMFENSRLCFQRFWGAERARRACETGFGEMGS
jgi:hypothetical protein